jgi:hypothetical protein
MVKVKSLDHTRFIITGTGTTDKARKLYYAGSNSASISIRDWTSHIGGAKAYNNLHEAQKVVKNLRERWIKTQTLRKEWVKETQTFREDEKDSTVKFKVELVQRKELMIARLKYNGEGVE